MSSVVGWKQSRCQVAQCTSRCPGITLKFSVFDNTFLPSQWRFHDYMLEPSDLIQSVLSMFNVASLLDYEYIVVFNISILFLMWEIYHFSLKNPHLWAYQWAGQCWLWAMSFYCVVSCTVWLASYLICNVQFTCWQAP